MRIELALFAAVILFMAFCIGMGVDPMLILK